MVRKSICPICNKRRAERYCPAKGEAICAVDCGTEREVTIDCPPDCAFLLAAHRWEQAHPRPLAESDISFPDVSFPPDLVHTHRAAFSGLAYAVLLFAREQTALSDRDIFSAVGTMAETYRTLLSGIYYEKSPDAPLAAGLYAAIARFLQEEKRRRAEHPEIAALKDPDVFHLLVFFLRFAQLRSNGRPRTRGFLEFLRAQFPREMGLAREEPRIIVP